jgi:hypothetical protein
MVKLLRSLFLVAVIFGGCSRDNPCDPEAENYMGKDAWKILNSVPVLNRRAFYSVAELGKNML